MDISKDSLLKQADALLAQARRARKLSASDAVDAEDRAQLIRDAEQCERMAAQLEKDAIGAKTGVFSGPPPRRPQQ
jgi:glycerol-3-phosphate O-acyltransferase